MNKPVLFTLALAAIAMTSYLFAEPATQPSGDKVTTPSGLTIITTEKGGDYVTQAGDHVWVHYAGRLEDGTEFDNSMKRGDPIDLTLGQGRVIAGWEEGLLGMRLGEKRQLIIPPALGYGERGAGGAIPPNATLIFDLELVGVRKGNR